MTGRSPLPPSPPESTTSSDRRNSQNWGNSYPFPTHQNHNRDRSSSLYSLASAASSISTTHSVPSHGRPISPPHYHSHPPPSYRLDEEQQNSLTLAPFADPSRALGSRTRLPSPTRLFPGLKTFAMREMESQWSQMGWEKKKGSW